MLKESLLSLYRWLRIHTYRRVFGSIREREGSLSATEAFSADVIHLLDTPTLKQFADCIGISQPNATYKVNMLVEKGYVKKLTPSSDRREIKLEMAEKFHRYYDDNSPEMAAAVERLQSQFTNEEILLADRVLSALLHNLEEEEKKNA